MTGTEEDGPAVRRAAPKPSADPILDGKLHRPPTRADWVERDRLLELLDRAVERPVTLVAAPAGFGKTTLATQWLASNRAPRVAAWVSLDSRDNDPVRLWTHVAIALERAGCPSDQDVASFMAAHASEVIAEVLPQLLASIADMDEDLVIFLDDFHFLRDVDCHTQVEFLVENLPQQAHLVVLTRADPGLRIAWLRATGRLSEIRAADLAFTAEETSSLLAVEQVHLSSDSVRDLVERTEGWAAGLYLATLSMAGRSDPDGFVREVSEGNRFIGDYLTEEVLASLSDEVRQFIRTMSILDRFSAPLADYMTGSSNSAALLAELERSNLFLIPCDEKRRWFRFHHLFASAARSDLELEEPERVPGLHAAAARWFHDHGHIDEAVMHSLVSGSSSEAAQLVQANWLQYVGAGRTATVVGWLDSLGPAVIASDPAARVTAAWMAALSGNHAALTDHLTALAEFEQLGPLPDGSRSVESAVAMIHGLFGYDGPVAMTRGAQRALELETDGRSPYYSIAHVSRGHAAYMAGDLDLATTLLVKASHNEAAPPIIRMVALACLSLSEGERGHQELSCELAEEAMQIIDAVGLRGTPQAAMAFSALGLAQAAGGDITTAATTIEQGLTLRWRNPAQGPWVLHHLLAGAHVALRVGQRDTAMQLAEEAATRMDCYPDGMERMRKRLRLVEGAIAATATNAATAQPDEPLTQRETEILRLLQGSLSLSEIAGELFISPNTVKTHAKAVYRKLGASSRTEAVRIGRHRLLV
jgi:LuxR family transcriptional regulator, maltose regulon positive regulatory protein